MISNNNALKSIILLCFIMNIYSECGPGQYKCPDFECCYCPIGTYSYDGNECLYCPPGTYNNFIGSSFCMNCGEGEYSLIMVQLVVMNVLMDLGLNRDLHIVTKWYIIMIIIIIIVNFIKKEFEINVLIFSHLVFKLVAVFISFFIFMLKKFLLFNLSNFIILIELL